MKKLLVLALLVSVGVGRLWAEDKEVTLNLAVDSRSGKEQPNSLETDGILLSVTSGASGNAEYDNGSIKFQKTSYYTISSTNYKIKKIVITQDKKRTERVFTANPTGTSFDAPDDQSKVFTWTGESQSIQFTNNSGGNITVSSIVVTCEALSQLTSFSINTNDMYYYEDGGSKQSINGNTFDYDAGKSKFQVKAVIEPDYNTVIALSGYKGFSVQSSDETIINPSSFTVWRAGDKRMWFDNLTVLKPGTVTLTFTFLGADNYATKTAVQEFTINKLTPTLSFASSSINAEVGSAVPSNALTVTPSSLGVTYTSSDATVATVNASTGVVTLKSGGTCTITATTTETDYYTSASTSYTLNVTGLFHGTTSYTTSAVTYTLDGEGLMDGGTTITTSVIDLTFGKAPDGWHVWRQTNSGRNQVLVATVVSGKGNPTGDDFFVFTPKVNGYLTVNGNFYSSQFVGGTYDETSGKYQIDVTSKADEYGDWAIEKPLIAGQTYRLKTKTWNAELHSFTYTPAYITESEVNKTGETIAFEIGTTPDFPYALTDKTDGITFSSSDKKVMEVNKNTGAVGVAGAGSATITCTWKTDKGENTMSWNITVTKPDNVYLVTETANAKMDAGDYGTKDSPANGYTWGDDNPDRLLSTRDLWEYDASGKVVEGEENKYKVTSVEGITMRFGGWRFNNSAYDGNDATYTPTYNSEGEINNGGKEDGWEYPHVDAVGYGDGVAKYTFDGVMASANGVNDPTDERPNDAEQFSYYNADTKGFYDIEKPSTFNLPCRGAYVTFEPTQNGTLTLYTLQNGCIDFYSKDEERKYNDVTTTKYENGKKYQFLKEQPYGYITWRPYFFTDEAGKCIEATYYQAKAPFTYTLDEIKAFVTETAYNYQGYRKLYYRGIMSDAQKKYILSSWAEGSETPNTENWLANGESTPIVKVADADGGGYISLMKSYAKYTFPVKAGKTYFYFSNYSKLGICGFKFEKDGSGQPATEITIENDAASNPLAAGQYAKVTLNRTFEADKWTSLCLPFSISLTQMREQFGKDVETIHFNRIGDNGRHIAYFDRHVYDQLLVEGVPVFIKPSKTVTNPEFTNVTVEGKAITTYDKYEGYTFTGIYGSQEMGNYSYFINDKLYWLNGTSGMKSKSMRAYLEGSESSGAKALEGLDFGPAYLDGELDGDITGIENILNDVKGGSLPATFDVFNMSGVKVRSKASTLDGLSKGVYMVNGQKYVVR